MSIQPRDFEIASQVLAYPPLNNEWLDEVACSDQAYGDGIEGGTAEMRAMLDRYYIKQVCGACTVKAACLVDAVRTGEIDLVRGGKRPAEVKRIATAHTLLMEKQQSLKYSP